jgi:hypothetical protein
VHHVEVELLEAKQARGCIPARIKRRSLKPSMRCVDGPEDAHELRVQLMAPAITANADAEVSNAVVQAL